MWHGAIIRFKYAGSGELNLLLFLFDRLEKICLLLL